MVFQVENTGNRVIKNQYLRFQFDNQSALLEDVYEPDPPKEYSVDRIHDQNERLERRYLIGQLECEQKVHKSNSHFQLECEQKVGIRFVLSSENSPQLEVFPKNEEGDISFVLRSQKKAADERQQITRFIFLVLLWYLFPSFLSLARFESEQQIAKILHICFDL